jgi:glycosyltransferase involved in cell wall biosynthesis
MVGSILRCQAAFGRTLLRARMYCLYPIRLFAHCGRVADTHARIVCTNTFYAPLTAALAQRNEGTRLVHLVYDLFPDALFEAEATKPGSILSRLCDSIVRRTFQISSANVFLGRRLLSHAEKRFGPIRNARIIPVGADGSLFASFPPRPPERDELIDILYCGNFGRLHDIDTLVGALASHFPAEGRPVRFSFRASGPGVKRLESLSRQSPQVESIVTIGGFLSGKAWIDRMKQAQVGLVTMRSGAERVLMPSKTYSALVAGQAILAICNQESDLAELVTTHHCGWVVEPGNVESLRGAIREIRTRPLELQMRRENAFRVGHSLFSTEHIAQQWKDLLDDL